MCTTSSGCICFPTLTISSVQYPKISAPSKNVSSPVQFLSAKETMQQYTTVGKTKKKERVKDEINLKPHVMDSTRNGYFFSDQFTKNLHKQHGTFTQLNRIEAFLDFLPFSICLLQGMHRLTIKNVRLHNS